MTEHISTNLIERYRQRRMEPLEMLALDQHTSNCVQCRQQLRAALSLNSSASALQASVPTWQMDDEHLSKNQLSSFLSGKLDAVDRELAESHLEFCDGCKSEITELLARQVPPAPRFVDKLADWFRKLADENGCY